MKKTCLFISIHNSQHNILSIHRNMRKKFFTRKEILMNMKKTIAWGT